MTLPGFTAESSMITDHNQYQAADGHASTGQQSIIPQMSCGPCHCTANGCHCVECKLK